MRVLASPALPGTARDYVLSRNVRVTRRLLAAGTDLELEEDLRGFERDYANGRKGDRGERPLDRFREAGLVQSSFEPLSV